MAGDSHLQGWLKQAGGLTSSALTLAQRSNFSPLAALGYQAWRERSLSWLSGQPLGLQREARLFLGLCGPQAGERWLDVGTSSGFYAGVLAGAGCEVLAADLSPPMLEVARQRVRSPQVVWARVNIEHSGMPDGDFDGVTIGATLNETRDPARLLAECARLLRPGGQLWLLYLSRTGGPLQRALSRPALGGLSFPDPRQTARWARPLERQDSLQIMNVTFEHFVRSR